MVELTGGMEEAQRQAFLYRYAFFTAGMSNLVMRWLSRDCAEPLEEILRVAMQPGDFF